MRNKRFFLKIIPILMTSLMLTGIPVYATENQPAQPAQQQEQQNQQQQAAQQQEQTAQQQTQQPAQEQNQQQQAAQQQEQAAQQQAAQQPAQEQTQQATGEAQQQTQQPAAVVRPTIRTVVTPAVVQQEEQAEDEAAEGEGEGAEGFTSEQGEYSLKLIKNANLREEPSTDAESSIIIPFGITISASQKVTNSVGETWYMSEYGGYTGYIRGDMADVTTISVQTAEEGEGEGEAEAEPEEEAPEETQEQPSQGVSKRANYRSTTKKTPVTINRQYNSQTYTSGDVEVEPREKIDLIFILFLGAAAIGCVFTYMMLISLRSEYRRYKRNKLSKERKN